MTEIVERLRILSDSEVKEIYGLPQLSQEERIHCFALSPAEQAATQELRAARSKAYFILQLGYFKIRRLFISFDLHEVQDDLCYVTGRYFDGVVLEDTEPLNKRTRLKHQQMILSLCRFRAFDATDRKNLETRAKQAARVSGKPIYVFRILMEHLAQTRVTLPPYRYMQDTVSRALVYERKRLETLLGAYVSQQDITSLSRLLEDGSQFYEVTHLRREPKDFSYGQIKEEIRKKEQMTPLYHMAESVIPRLDISSESIKYYASLVGYYSVYKLKRFEKTEALLYLLCFIFHRYQKANDNLIDCLNHYMRHYWDSARKSARERIYLSQKETGENIRKAGKALEVFLDDSMDATTPIAVVREQAFTILEREKLSQAARHMTSGTAALDEITCQWEYVDTVSSQFKKRVRPLVQSIDFATVSNSETLLQATHFLKAAFSKGIPLNRQTTHQFPMRCIRNNTRRYLFEHTEDRGKQIVSGRYEFQIYRLLRDNLEAGNISCRDSVRYRSLEDELVDDRTWENKEQLIAEAGLPTLQQPIKEHLAELNELLETKMCRVNNRIAAGENTHFKITRHGKNARWTLQYPRESDPVNHGLFETLPQVDIDRVLHFVDERCGFMEEFEHLLGRYTKKEADELLITACLIGWGTNMGLGKMGAISNIRYELLSSASESFLRLETLRAANDRISNATSRLAIFRHYDIGEVIHSSSDGQKIETQAHTLRSRHSAKYFGLSKGLSANTMTANHVPVNAILFGSHDHESHYVFDLIYNNSSDIQPTIHSTDTHGSNQVNFAILHLFGYQFAPRYRDICDTVANSLYGFKNPHQYGDVQLKPIRKINEALIIEEWDNIRRIMVSLARKDTTQNIIVGKLSSHARKNKTCRALWEYDHIIRSLYLLDYVDSLSLRRNVQKAVNRTESYHKLRRAIAYANGGKLRYRAESDQEVWSECSRLIANCIIHYNACILSDILEHYETNEDRDNADRLKHVSPIAWQHINLYGRYEFQRDREPINLSAVVQQLLKHRNPYEEAIHEAA